VSLTAARAELRIVWSAGGEAGSYLRLFAVVRQSGERVIIDGPCLSACTLVLSTIPQDRICVTPRALFGNIGLMEPHSSSESSQRMIPASRLKA